MSTIAGSGFVKGVEGYDVLASIGQGQYSVVFKAVNLASGQLCALKRIHSRHLKNSTTKQRLLQESELLERLDHVNIIKHFETFFHNDELYMQLEWIDGGDLKQHIEQARTQDMRFSEARIWEWFYQLTGAVDHMHERNIMHRDLKPSNVFLTMSGVVKIGDFGLGRFFGEHSLIADSVVGTPYYMSPQVLKGEAYHFESDIWSLGCVLYELACFDSPFGRLGAGTTDIVTLIQHVTCGNYQVVHERTTAYSRALSNVVDGCLADEPNDRPTAHDLFQMAGEWWDRQQQVDRDSRARGMLTNEIANNDTRVMQPSDFGQDALDPALEPADVVGDRGHRVVASSGSQDSVPETDQFDTTSPKFETKHHAADRMWSQRAPPRAKFSTQGNPFLVKPSDVPHSRQASQPSHQRHHSPMVGHHPKPEHETALQRSPRHQQPSPNQEPVGIPVTSESAVRDQDPTHNGVRLAVSVDRLHKHEVPLTQVQARTTLFAMRDTPSLKNQFELDSPQQINYDKSRPTTWQSDPVPRHGALLDVVAPVRGESPNPNTGGKALSQPAHVRDQDGNPANVENVPPSTVKHQRVHSTGMHVTAAGFNLIPANKKFDGKGIGRLKSYATSPVNNAASWCAAPDEHLLKAGLDGTSPLLSLQRVAEELQRITCSGTCAEDISEQQHCVKLLYKSEEIVANLVNPEASTLHDEYGASLSRCAQHTQEILQLTISSKYVALMYPVASFLKTVCIASQHRNHQNFRDFYHVIVNVFPKLLDLVAKPEPGVLRIAQEYIDTIVRNIESEQVLILLLKHQSARSGAAPDPHNLDNEANNHVLSMFITELSVILSNWPKALVKSHLQEMADFICRLAHRDDILPCLSSQITSFASLLLEEGGGHFRFVVEDALRHCANPELQGKLRVVRHSNSGEREQESPTRQASTMVANQQSPTMVANQQSPTMVTNPQSPTMVANYQPPTLVTTQQPPSTTTNEPPIKATKAALSTTIDQGEGIRKLQIDSPTHLPSRVFGGLDAQQQNVLQPDAILMDTGGCSPSFWSMSRSSGQTTSSSTSPNLISPGDASSGITKPTPPIRIHHDSTGKPTRRGSRISPSCGNGPSSWSSSSSVHCRGMTGSYDPDLASSVPMSSVSVLEGYGNKNAMSGSLSSTESSNGRGGLASGMRPSPTPPQLKQLPHQRFSPRMRRNSLNVSPRGPVFMRHVRSNSCGPSSPVVAQHLEGGGGHLSSGSLENPSRLAVVAEDRKNEQTHSESSSTPPDIPHLQRKDASLSSSSSSSVSWEPHGSFSSSSSSHDSVNSGGRRDGDAVSRHRPGRHMFSVHSITDSPLDRLRKRVTATALDGRPGLRSHKEEVPISEYGGAAEAGSLVRVGSPGQFPPRDVGWRESGAKHVSQSECMQWSNHEDEEEDVVAVSKRRGRSRDGGLSDGISDFSDGISDFRDKSGELDYKLWTLLGQGGFSQVFKAVDSRTGKFYAVKRVMYQQNSENESSTAKMIVREINLYKKLDHPHIVKYYGCHMKENGYLHIFLEYCAGGSIAQMLRNFKQLNESLIRLYTRQIVLALAYLHDNGIVHRDVKGANVLTTSNSSDNGVAKLSDFGCTFFCPELVQGANMEHSMVRLRGTPAWMAPEAARQQKDVSFASDIWSVGATVIEMATAKPPWVGFEFDVKMLIHIATTKEPPAFPDNLSEVGKDFLDKCLRIDPAERWTAKQLLQHPFLDDRKPNDVAQVPRVPPSPPRSGRKSDRQMNGTQPNHGEAGAAQHSRQGLREASFEDDATMNGREDDSMRIHVLHGVLQLLMRRCGDVERWCQLCVDNLVVKQPLIPITASVLAFGAQETGVRCVRADAGNQEGVVVGVRELLQTAAMQEQSAKKDGGTSVWSVDNFEVKCNTIEFHGEHDRVTFSFTVRSVRDGTLFESSVGQGSASFVGDGAQRTLKMSQVEFDWDACAFIRQVANL